MESEIVRLVSRYMPLSEEEAAALADCIPVRAYPKGRVLLEAGEIAHDCYFTIQGCVRSYYLVDGEEKTTAFYTEEQAIASMNSYLRRVPANHYLACVEDCRLAVLNYECEKELYLRFPAFESLCRVSMEEDFARQQERLDNYITTSPEERYLDLLEHRADLLHRVPQYQLASYLGVKPESLSRIRKRVSLKGKQ